MTSEEVTPDEIQAEAAFMGQRIVDEIRVGVYFDPTAKSSMEAVVRVIETRELRRRLLADITMNMGYQLADFLQDREGWHGADRAEARERVVQALS